MTPKEKAKELYESFYFIDSNMKDYIAKESSLICVEKIINTNPTIKIRVEKNNCSWIETQSNIKYWEEVKKEITFL